VRSGCRVGERGRGLMRRVWSWREEERERERRKRKEKRTEVAILERARRRGVHNEWRKEESEV